MKLTYQNVEYVLRECLFKDREDRSNAIKVRGVIRDFGLHPDRVRRHREDIRSMLNELPSPFHAATGGGWSFLNACMTRDGEQWGEHLQMEALFVLGIAAGMAKETMPPDMRDVLPGGMPYYTVDTSPS